MPDLNSKNLAAQIAKGKGFIVLPQATTAQLASLTSAINTVGKLAAKPVLNTTTHKVVTAAGPLAADHWYDAAGTDAHTPV